MSARQRHLGLGSATALVVASMIGAGVFTSSGYALADLGHPLWVLLAWAVAGVVAVCGALCYGALARRFPESGGEYLLLTRTLHPLAGLMAGWVSLLAGFTAPIAIAALGFQAYLAPLLGMDPTGKGLALIVVAVAVVQHAFHVSGGVWMHNLAVAVKLLLLLGGTVVGGFALSRGAGAGWSQWGAVPSFDAGAFAVVLVWTSFAYSGWNAAIYIGGEVKDPERNLGRALLTGASLVLVLYMLLNLVFLAAAPASALAGNAEVGLIAAEHLGGTAATAFVGALVCLALYTSVSSMMLLGPRVYSRMAEDGYLPEAFRLGRNMPGLAVVSQGVLAALVILWSDLAQLLSYIGFTLGLSAAATILGLVLERRRHGADNFPIPGWPLTPAVFLVVTLWASAYLAVRHPVEAAYGLLTVAVGLILALFRRR